MMPEVGDALGAGYRLLARVGSGAAGEVWRVRDLRDNSERAAKLLRPEHVQDPSLVERFIRERSVLIALRHPNVVEVVDLVVEGGTLAIVMEFVRGGSLRERLAASGPLRAATALAATAAILDALAAAHAMNTVHRDVKPDNILLVEGVDDLGAAVRVSDFGIAHVVADGPRATTGIIGTPEYISPEMLSTGEAGPPSDVYASGILLYELLCGRTPFAGVGNDFAVAYRHVSSQPPPLEVPAALWRALERMLAKNPAERFSAAEAAAALRALAPRVAAVPALARSAPAAAFEEVARPATVLRGVVGGAPDRDEPWGEDAPAPELGTSSQATMIRSVPRRELRAVRAAAVAPPVAGRRRWDKRMILAGIGAVVVLIGAVVVATLPRSGATAPESSREVMTAQQQDRPLPSGLGISRSATYDPDKGALKVVLTYSAQSAALSGSLLEVLPGADSAANCPAVSWASATGTRNQPSVTGVGATCGWSLAGVHIPAKGSVEVTATVSIALADHKALDSWLASAAAATTSAVSDSGVSGTAYPVQRIRDVQVRTPTRTVSQTALPVTLVPVWSSGADPVNPLFSSPSVGAASAMLDAIAGGVSGVRFSDGCSGAVAVSSDGLTITALSMVPECTLRARVGNFSDVTSTPFAITTRE
ncbi:serine/threonine protein kinase [Rathayibacter toxicus]|nr:serine/threonine protein kinase [Rathayibacter toxicus]QOD11448.1 serine/threonine protein kinase [Rathayibacter toxicus]QWL27661.1 serine/threonine protein kinase [Rathayibacter toxicus]QWL31879.1 serine/threonine protein kinase [Rathayibacter toxicus]QWL33972.1 serine/threonine protein kinase [Rathayibacter toxicus]